MWTDLRRFLSVWTSRLSPSLASVASSSSLCSFLREALALVASSSASSSCRFSCFMRELAFSTSLRQIRLIKYQLIAPMLTLQDQIKTFHSSTINSNRSIVIYKAHQIKRQIKQRKTESKYLMHSSYTHTHRMLTYHRCTKTF